MAAAASLTTTSSPFTPSEDEANPPYLVHAVHQGMSLRTRLDREGPLSLRERLAHRLANRLGDGGWAHTALLLQSRQSSRRIPLENGVESSSRSTAFVLARRSMMPS